MLGETVAAWGPSTASSFTACLVSYTRLDIVLSASSSLPRWMDTTLDVYLPEVAEEVWDAGADASGDALSGEACGSARSARRPRSPPARRNTRDERDALRLKRSCSRERWSSRETQK